MGLVILFCDCNDDEVFSSVFYEVQYSVEGTKLKLSVKKENTVSKVLLVISVNGDSDIITSNVLVKAYSFKKVSIQ